MKAVANQGNSFQPVDPASVDWSDMTTTAPQPTEDQLRSLARDLAR